MELRDLEAIAPPTTSVDKRLKAAFRALAVLGCDRTNDSDNVSPIRLDNLERGVRNSALNLIRNVINGEITGPLNIGGTDTEIPSE